MITANVLYRTFHLRCGKRKGTCFSVDVDNHQYVVTARHLVHAVGSGALVEILHGGKWKPLDVLVVGHGPPQVDVTVLALKFRITRPEFALELGSHGVKLGQETFILGYPQAEWGGGGASGQSFPAPFVKKATVALLPGEASAVRCLFLDGYSNQGFAGGPVVFREADTGVFRVAAVASTFQNDGEPVYLGSEELRVSAQHNPDLIVAFDIKHAIDLITLNPVGFALTED